MEGWTSNRYNRPKHPFTMPSDFPDFASIISLANPDLHRLIIFQFRRAPRRHSSNEHPNRHTPGNSLIGLRWHMRRGGVRLLLQFLEERRHGRRLRHHVCSTVRFNGGLIPLDGAFASHDKQRPDLDDHGSREVDGGSKGTVR